MPFLLDTASAIKRRFGFQDQSVSESVPCTPDLLKSVSRDHHLASTQSVFATSAVRRISDMDDDDDHGGATGSEVAAPRHAQSYEFSEDPSFWKDHNVQVIIRLRPLTGSEISVQGHSKCVRQESCQTITWTGHPESRFTFDLVADETVSQEKMFKVAGLPMVDNCMGGYNSCMFAYGQTGSGKTHTMLGDIEGGTRRHSVNCGMTPRVFEYLFSRIQKEKEARKEEKIKFTCKCSFLEIYNEQILDLLDPSSSNLQIREDVKKGIYVDNLKEIEVTSARDVLQQLIQGAANRKVAATNMNHASSRSHSVFTCIIESKWESQGVTHHRFARLNLVDLAGSERQKSSGAEGERLKEATNINKSLSTLGLVIMNLVSISNGKSLHVPYRDSKLTFLLQDSLGGNSKTIIIANISPSLCCSLETLSTLKFAQRAKFIKNNAIINEDASGDVIVMRMQIQQLKKEVSRLRSLVNGGVENLDNDTSSLSCLGSPGQFQWEGLHGSSSPLMPEKRMSQKKDYEVALIGAFRREKDKDIALKALKAENQAAMQLAKQREDEIKSLKMIVRFREAGVKRLEAVAAGKISAETHLLKEKEEHLKEIEVWRTQVDRNQEVTRFATENLRLKEEIRRLKSFCEEGEREMMNEQIMVLQNKLLEALDWKLMHETDSSAVQKTSLDMETEVQDELPISIQEPRSPCQSSINEENEFLRIQTIQNQAEIDLLHKQLEFCFEEKDRLERHVNDLMMKLEEERSYRATNERTEQLELPLSTDASVVNANDQMELKTMVDAIAAASQREAEAHEKAITLYTENNDLQLKLETFIVANEELQSKLKALIEEKNSLIEMYERAASKSSYNNVNDSKSEQNGMEVRDDDNSAERGQNGMEVHNNDSASELANLSELEMKTVENLEQQRMELHEENEKLMGLYEIAMHERDELRRRLSSYEQNRVESRGELHCSEKHVEIDGEKCLQSCAPPTYLGTKVSVEEIRARLLNAEQAFVDFDEVLREIEATEEGLQLKQEEFRSLELLSSEMQDKKALVDKKLSALRYSLSNFSSSVAYFEQREVRAKARVNASMSYFRKKKEELACLQVCKEDTEANLGRIQQSEIELRNILAVLKSKLEEKNQRQESEKVLFAIDNIEKVDTSQRNWQLGGKATELLKSEEEKTKLQSEMKLSREKLGLVKREYEDLSKRLDKIESEIQVVQMDIQKGSKSVEELELALQTVTQEKETLLEITENGMSEIQSMIIEYQQCVFDTDLKEAELNTLEEELQLETRRIEELRKVQAAASEKMTRLLQNTSSHSCFAEKMEE
ncbi:PREDICTED: phragmoplast orienting kinesin-1 isoform X1 [Populus euphratica]|uniref:Phragmoplast orienting kinesin-1 isoform X1 n=1 Tax=Populus euphratica TaxID=75702 RepID=A0AAJ6Y630_POPEU|nr:PREDICTED: phragmoplast orienting kinesin-1 isoform X1 [Populus euphratica]